MEPLVPHPAETSTNNTDDVIEYMHDIAMPVTTATIDTTVDTPVNITAIETNRHVVPRNHDTAVIFNISDDATDSVVVSSTNTTTTIVGPEEMI